MQKLVGLIVQGDEKKNTLTVKAVHEENGDLSIYNVIHAGAGNDTLSGRPELVADYPVHRYGVELLGEEGDDSIYDSYRSDTLSGGDGDDVIYFHHGLDQIDGGDGYDSLRVEQSYAHLGSISAVGIEELVLHGQVYCGSFDFSAIEVIRPDKHWYSGSLTFSQQADLAGVKFLGSHAWLTGSKYDDNFNLYQSSAKLSVTGGGGNDTIIGGSNRDDLQGSLGDDWISGGDSNDVLYGGKGNDTLTGGDGNDRLFGFAGSDVLSGGDGDDILSNAENKRGGYTTSRKDFDVFDGGAGNDSFRMSRLFDITASHFLGGAGTDDITLGGDISHMIIKDIEILNSGHGRDSIRVDADVLDSFEQIFLRSRKYEIEFSTGGDFTWKDGSQEANLGVLRGSGQSDHIDLSATEGNWKINTGDGADVVQTGAGISYVAGGIGRDTFVFDGTRGRTAIMDFTIGGKDSDRIDVSDIDAVTSFKDLFNHNTHSEGRWLYMQFGKTEIALLDVDRSDLDESDFIF